VKRLEFIALVSDTVAWPLVSAQQAERVRRLGVLMNLAADDLEARADFCSPTEPSRAGLG
jgi:hypothetical protein